MKFKGPDNEPINVDIYELDGVYYSRMPGENAIEWRISEDAGRKAEYKVVYIIPKGANEMADLNIPEDLARTLEAVYTHSPE